MGAKREEGVDDGGVELGARAISQFLEGHLVLKGLAVAAVARHRVIDVGHEDKDVDPEDDEID